jgi:hypothetical protein
MLALGAGAFALACSGPQLDLLAGDVESPPSPAAEPTPAPAPRVAPTPPPTPTPRPVPPAGREERVLLADTEWATPAYLTHSGVEGSRVVVLGGVHGNEPGGWQAAEAIADWEVERGSLVVVPRANRIATLYFERTLPELGDLNRLYPGHYDGMPMARMASEIVALSREVHADILLDLHESWGFFNERGANSGTAFIGQTVTSGANSEFGRALRSIVEGVNEQLTAREELILRERFGGNFGGRVGTSSLSLGTHVPGLTPVLIEMGQQNQTERRRAEIHRLITEAVLRHEGMLA